MNIKDNSCGCNRRAFLSITRLFAERYVRYEEHGTVSWGELVDGVVHQLSSAPYHGGKRTGSYLE